MNRFLNFQQKGKKRASSLDRVCQAERILLSDTGRAIAVHATVILGHLSSLALPLFSENLCSQSLYNMLRLSQL